MKRLLLFAVPVLLFAESLCAQVDPYTPLSLDDLISFVSDPTEVGVVPEVIAKIKFAGLGFSLTDTALSHVIDASIKGKRDPMLTAKLVLQLFESCLDCRQRYFGPWSKSKIMELLADKKIAPAQLVQEIKFRSVTGFPKTAASVEELRNAGATPELIDAIIPLDELEAPTPQGYERVPLLRAPQYGPTLQAGVLSIFVHVTGEVEFLFRKNALFTKAVAGKKIPAKSEILMSTFTAPVRRIGKTELEVYEALDRKSGRLRGKDDSKRPQIDYIEGQDGFKFVVGSSDKDSHTYEIRIAYGATGIAK